MVISVRCFSCSKVLGNRHSTYQRNVRMRKLEKGMDPEKIIYLTNNNMEKTIEGQVLDELKIKCQCCRIRFLTYVDIF